MNIPLVETADSDFLLKLDNLNLEEDRSRIDFLEMLLDIDQNENDVE